MSLGWLVAVAVLATACSSSTATIDEADGLTTAAPAATSPSSEPDDDDPIAADASEVAEPVVDDNLEPDAQAVMDAWEITADGGAVAFIRNADGYTATLASGLDPSTKAPLSPNDRVRVGSISKLVTATMVMQLVDQGLIDLDEPVSAYLPELELPGDPSVRDVLGHRSGIANYTDTRVFGLVAIAQPESEPSPVDLISYVDPEPQFEAGTTFAYSNTNYVVAGLLVEHATGQSLAQALAEQIADPLGLVATEFADGTLTDVAGGYSGMMPSGNSFDQSYNSIAYGSWAAGGLVTTVDELAAILDALLFGDLVSASSLAEMLGTVPDGGEYGLGIHGGPDFGVGHGGAIVGFTSIAQVDTDTREMVVVVVNNDTRAPEVISRQLTSVIRGESGGLQRRTSGAGQFLKNVG